VEFLRFQRLFDCKKKAVVLLGLTTWSDFVFNANETMIPDSVEGSVRWKMPTI